MDSADVEDTPITADRFDRIYLGPNNVRFSSLLRFSRLVPLGFSPQLQVGLRPSARNSVVCRVFVVSGGQHLLLDRLGHFGNRIQLELPRRAVSTVEDTVSFLTVRYGLSAAASVRYRTVDS
jgi:hypothetical protein